ncbi:MAG: hypothetical protein AAF656_00495 [Planctomycetota bacterium]
MIDLSDPKAVAAVVLNVFPILISTISSYFGLFLEKPAEFRKRVKLFRKECEEAVAQQHASVLNRMRSVIESSEKLRDEGEQFLEPNSDPVGAYSRELFRLVMMMSRVEMFRFVYRMAFKVLLFVGVAGVVCTVVALTVPSASTVLLFVGGGLLVIALATVVTAYMVNQSLEDYEETVR